MPDTGSKDAVHSRDSDLEDERVLQGSEDRSPASSANRSPASSARLSSTTRRGYRLRRALLASDLIAFLAALLVASGFSEAISRGGDIEALLIAISICAPAWFLIAQGSGLYHLSDRSIDFSAIDEIGPTIMVTTVWLWMLLLVSTVIVDGPLAMAWFFSLWVSAICFVLVGRAIVRRVTRDRSWYRQDVLLIGDQRGINRVLRRIRRHPECGLDPVGVLKREGRTFRASSFESTKSTVRLDASISAVGSEIEHVDEVVRLIAGAGIERAIITDWGSSFDERTELIRLLVTSGVFVDLVSGDPETLCAGAAIHDLEGLPIMTVRPTQMTKTTRLIKRVVDIVGAGIGLLVLAPLLLYLSVRIKLDSPGPVLFRQARAGQDGRVFEMVKFRTMVDGADQQRDELRSDLDLEGLFKLKSDRRITSYGSKIRGRSLDELPQLWNVLRGDMSLVGPRPLPLDEAPLVVDHFADRLRVRPGITGLWQVHGRSDIPFEDMVKLDYTYVANYSLQEDFRLLFRTVGAVVGGRGAY